MQAPVYRNIEAANSFLGLAFPAEVLLVLAAFWLSILTLPPLFCVAATSGTYALIRISGWGKPPQFLQHWLQFHLRRRLYAGRLSCVARAHLSPRFPFAVYRISDAPSSCAPSAYDLRPATRD